ncbi:unnamed protein product [Miscanthus lutarioriparius]|uniref:Ubiquitin-like protease family profile domain-containing protein n=1 Tax=Miscanthus lutarioriparius TaxID=422564 RepID=A0A811N2D9_9POAL|nr:unnamed protein product [Miscanthus lutarioriparius]
MTHYGFSSRHCLNFTKSCGHSYHELVDHEGGRLLQCAIDSNRLLEPSGMQSRALKYTSTIDELAKSFHLNKSRSILLSYNCIGNHHVLLDISVERTTVNVYDSQGSQLENIHPFIEALNKAYEKFKSRSKKRHELGRSRFRVVSAGSIPMPPAGNDLCGFYVMHYMHSLINALSSSQVWPLSPFRNLDDLATYFECVAKLSLTVFRLFLVFQTEVSSTPEQTDLEISGFQEDLSSFIIDKVMNPKGVHHLL